MRNKMRMYGAKEMTDERVEKITEKSPALVETHGPQTKNGVISNTSLVKVRKSPDLSSDVLEILQKGEKVTILGRANNCFYKVSTDKNAVAYIFTDYVKEE